MNFTFYRATGEIVSSGFGPELFAQLNHPADGGYVEGEYSRDTHYIHNGQPTPRPASPITRSGLTLNNVPTGSTLFIDGTAYPAQGTVDLSFPLPGTYALRVECFPYLDFVDEVTV